MQPLAPSHSYWPAAASLYQVKPRHLPSGLHLDLAQVPVTFRLLHSTTSRYLKTRSRAFNLVKSP
ncbi:hypothetical protein CHLRE_02g141906v5 [Chlamydomonas reinhardtii]|uniref:Uncharacterized protein n=1 Tax=Chlamydomonas reinhardtii TaxID=3055 RepID=A0A2K3E4A0_CHLRE|nr:uncharacterized protein CHLRE_02g141906v5 [Chlamydomonas reinhardtii]PNW87628.1 hypothetical protein CHLRE_02g141906v5 [Chlamydomonas reinhardtii]